MHQGTAAATTTTAPAPPFLSNKTTTTTTTTGCHDEITSCLYPDNTNHHHPLNINDDDLQVRIKEIFSKDDR